MILLQTSMTEQIMGTFPPPSVEESKLSPIVWNEADLLEFANGDIANVFGQEYGIIDTYARALADSGDMAGAVKWQKKAVEAASENEQLKKQLAKTLEEYEKKAAEGI